MLYTKNVTEVPEVKVSDDELPEPKMQQAKSAQRQNFHSKKVTKEYDVVQIGRSRKTFIEDDSEVKKKSKSAVVK